MPDMKTACDVNSLRKQFPALHQSIGEKPLVYLDSAATSQKPRSVLEAIDHFYEHDNANVHRGIHELSRRATIAYEDARGRVANFIGAADASELIWTRGTTEGINLVAGTWGLDNLSKGDEILLTTMEHHSNIVPWQLVAGRTGARLRYIEMDDEGRLDLSRLDELIGPKTKLVTFNHISNALGTINPASTLIEAAKSVGARVLIDGAQAAPHGSVNVSDLGCDFYVFSGHKMCGPTGIGALWARRELLEEMSPYHGGGEMIHVVGRDTSSWAEVPHKFEAGTPNIAGAVGMAAAVDFLEGIGWDAIQAHERDLMSYAMERVGSVAGIKVYGPEALAERSAVVSFTMGDAHPHDISTILDSEGVAVRAGHHCAQLVMKHFEISATARASFYLYNTREDIDALVHGLDIVSTIFA
jgi:cysteine desulfurase / selenocysteine lyase